MKIFYEIDGELKKEIRNMNGDSSRAARLAMRDKVYAASKDLSTTKAPEIFTECLKKHGRGAVALAVASTLYERRERLEWWGMGWALAILDLWTTKKDYYVESAAIRDGLHPSKICIYAGSFIKLTGERVEA